MQFVKCMCFGVKCRGGRGIFVIIKCNEKFILCIEERQHIDKRKEEKRT